jgi:hypothetical protein
MSITENFWGVLQKGYLLFLFLLLYCLIYSKNVTILFSSECMKYV